MPHPAAAKNGSPPTAAKERTGELTPPGMTLALRKSVEDRALLRFDEVCGQRSAVSRPSASRAASLAW